ncbi:MAG: exodeoxyribonuclease VII large subunit, partial [Clostridia bacterium]
MEHTFSVKEISNYIKQVIDAEAVWNNILVMGEVSSYNVTRGIAYFNIKDEDSLLSCVLFNAEKYGPVKIGDKVLLRGSVKYYVKGGRLSFNAISLQQYGQGELYQKFLQLKEKLTNEGLFDESHKKPLPQDIKRVGVVTSRTGAVIRDIINVSTRRNPMIDIVLYNAQVQGVCAVEQIIDGIKFFDQYDPVDVIVVARGGGSIEDLQPFNEEAVARAVYECNKPLVSAVGHETDFTIIDFVADLRAPTPSAAAELVTTDMSGVVAKLKNALAGLTYEENKRLDMYYTNTTNRVLKLKNTLDLELNQHNNTLMHYKQNMNVFIDNVLQENA